MHFIKKAFRKFTKPAIVYTISDIPEDSELIDEIEKVFLDMQTLGLSDGEIRTAIHSLKDRNKFNN